MHALGRNDEAVERALSDLDGILADVPDETQARARAALEVLRLAFTSVRASAATDPLTGLANRSSFYHILDERLAVGVGGTSGAVLFLDLDGFKDVNDVRGHQAGDVLLSEVATRISRSVRDQDLVARHGGDEFVVLLENIENPAIAHSVAARIIEAISVPFAIEGARVQLGVSIGIAFYPEHGLSGSELLQRADSAMYRAKGQGGRGYAVFGEREDLIIPRTPRRSWAWELAPLAADLPSNDVTRALFGQGRKR